MSANDNATPMLRSWVPRDNAALAVGADGWPMRSRWRPAGRCRWRWCATARAAAWLETLVEVDTPHRSGRLPGQ